MPAIVNKLGPGEVTVGAAPLDFSCQVTAAHVDWSVDEGDDTVVLCGETVPGARTYSSVFAGTLLQDLAAPTNGIVDYSWANKGTQQPFVFVPSTTAGKQVTGTLIIDPLSVGGDEAGQNMTSDFEWKIVGEPVLAAVTGLVATADVVGYAHPVGTADQAAAPTGKRAAAAA